MKIIDFLKKDREEAFSLRGKKGIRFGALEGRIESLSGQIEVLEGGVSPIELAERMTGWDFSFFAPSVMENCSDDPEAKPVIEKYLSYERGNEKRRMASVEEDFLKKGKDVIISLEGNVYVPLGPDYTTKIFTEDFKKWRDSLHKKYKTVLREDEEQKEKIEAGYYSYSVYTVPVRDE